MGNAPADPVRYHIEVEHWLDGDIKYRVIDIDCDDTSKLAVAASMRRIADRLEAEVADPSLAVVH